MQPQRSLELDIENVHIHHWKSINLFISHFDYCIPQTSGVNAKRDS